MARKAELTSNMESDEEVPERKKRKPSRYSSVSESDNADDEDEENLESLGSQGTRSNLPLPPLFPTPRLEDGHKKARQCCPTSVRLNSREIASSSSVDRGNSTRVRLYHTPNSHVLPPAIASTSTASSVHQEFENQRSVNQSNEDQNFQNRVFLKLDVLLEYQKEQLLLLRKISGALGSRSSEEMDDLIPEPLTSETELEELCEHLREAEYCKKMIAYLSGLGGYGVRDSIRRMLKAIATNKVWSLFSLKGKKGKRALQPLPVCGVLIKACARMHTKANVSEIEEIIAETLKHAPNQPGGARYKDLQRTKQIHHQEPEE